GLMSYSTSLFMFLVGYLIRRADSESPVFTEMQERRLDSSAPLGELLRKHKRPVLLAALIFAGNNAAGYLVIAFFASYGANVLDMPLPGTLVRCRVRGAGGVGCRRVVE